MTCLGCEMWEAIAEDRLQMIESLKEQAAALGLQVSTDSNGIYIREKEQVGSD